MLHLPQHTAARTVARDVRCPWPQPVVHNSRLKQDAGVAAPADGVAHSRTEPLCILSRHVCPLASPLIMTPPVAVDPSFCVSVMRLFRMDSSCDAFRPEDLVVALSMRPIASCTPPRVISFFLTIVKLRPKSNPCVLNGQIIFPHMSNLDVSSTRVIFIHAHRYSYCHLKLALPCSVMELMPGSSGPSASATFCRNLSNMTWYAPSNPIFKA
mmetsp:Transcript_16975/g.50875  ORF Transcript_16975/g.50875 Transcript_16975/m.50875 type:complete len:212 (+) Transcript_16975:1720-2355(+)